MVIRFTRTQEQILIFLLENPEEKNTIRGISRKLKKSYTLVYNNIRDLEKKETVKKQLVPPAQIVTLNEHAPLETFIDLEFKRKDNFLKKHPWAKVMLADILKNINGPFFILAVFGSYAKGLQNEKSDLDLLMIVNHKKEIKDAENAVQKAYAKVKKSLNVVDICDFKEMIKNTKNLNIGNEAKTHHILLYGIEGYYHLIR